MRAKRKKINIMSLSVDLEIQERLKTTAKKRHISVSKLVRDMVDKQIPGPEEMVDIVILKIPSELRSKPEELSRWITIRADAIVKALTA